MTLAETNLLDRSIASHLLGAPLDDDIFLWPRDNVLEMMLESSLWEQQVMASLGVENQWWWEW